MTDTKLQIFPYDYNSGPLKLKDLNKPLKMGNCRLAIQHYFYCCHHRYFQRKDMLAPRVYCEVGNFVARPNRGDVIFAEKKIRSKDISDVNSWIVGLHTAIYIGKPGRSIIKFLPTGINLNDNMDYIWHSSLLSKGSAFWTLDELKKHYDIIAIKRLI